MRQHLPILRLAAVAAMIAAAPARADDPVSPEEFADYAQGWTLYYEEDGEPAGAEQFRPDGRVRWRDADGECIDGVWRAHRDMACFYYGPGSEVLCWTLHRTRPRGNIVATLTGESEDAGLELEIVRRDRAPLLCRGEGAAS